MINVQFKALRACRRAAAENAAEGIAPQDLITDAETERACSRWSLCDGSDKMALIPFVGGSPLSAAIR